MIDEHDEKVRALEAVLFAADGPLNQERIALVLDLPVEDVEALVEALSRAMADSALQVVQLAGGYQLATRARFAGYVQRLREPEPERLSAQALETLAIIAYLQPITRPEIDEIRGVNSTASVNGLLEKGLVAIAGRKDAPGRPFLLVTTAHFLSTFGLNELSELPELSPVDADFREQLRELVGQADENAPADEGAPADEDAPDHESASADQDFADEPGDAGDAPAAEADASD